MRRQHEERRRQRVCRPARSDCAFLHGFEQRRLSLRGRAVDFVGQQQLRKDGSLTELETVFSGVVGRHNIRPNDVRWHQVRRKLDAAKLQFEDLRQGLDEFRFPEAGDAFQQHVASAKQCCERRFDHTLLANNHFANGITDGLKLRTKLIRFCLKLCRSKWFGHELLAFLV